MDLNATMEEIWRAIEKCFPIYDTVWFDESTTLYDEIGLILTRRDAE